jgi:hypothetical protein
MTPPLSPLSSAVLPALLAVALAAPGFAAPRAAGSSATPATNSVASCGEFLQSAAGISSVQMNPSCGVTQPLGIIANVAACSLSLGLPWDASGSLRVVQWDPLGLAPDPTTVALRTLAFSASALTNNHVGVSFSQPVVVRSVDHVADPPGSTVALDFQMDPASWDWENALYDGNAAAEVPAGFQYGSNGVRIPLPGSHPGVGHVICGGDASVQALEVVQSVMRANALLDTANEEVIQRFRVPVRTTLQWVELAFDAYFIAPSITPGVVAIYDGTGSTSPPVTLPLVTTSFGQFYTQVPRGWSSPYDFDQVITLEPNHDYWLRVAMHHVFPIYSRVLTGGESDDFTTSIGGFYGRTTATGTWTSIMGHALSFRLIGEPQAETAILTPAPTRGGLRLSVEPTPSRGTARVRWTGAAGALRIDVLDARGRRVAHAENSPGERGQWVWNGLDDAGRALPAAVYFLRATDDARRVATGRVVWVR